MPQSGTGKLRGDDNATTGMPRCFHLCSDKPLLSFLLFYMVALLIMVMCVAYYNRFIVLLHRCVCLKMDLSVLLSLLFRPKQSCSLLGRAREGDT